MPEIKGDLNVTQRVGIATSSPQASLHIDTPDLEVIRIQRNTGPTASNYRVQITPSMTDSVADLQFQCDTNSTGYSFRTRNGSGSSVFGLGIDRDGRVGIGDTGPENLLKVFTSGSTIEGISLGDASDTLTASKFIGITNGTQIIADSGFQGIEFGPKNGTGEGYLAFHTHDLAVASAVRMTIDKSGLVGIGLTAPISQLSVDQPSTTGAIPVLQLDQGDIDDTFINFIGTSASDGSRSISSDTTEDSTKFGAVRVEINGTTKWVRIYDNES